ncbi:MAG: archaeosortase/exosortase family protein [Candidatus Norongarragalinales archaeon]
MLRFAFLFFVPFALVHFVDFQPLNYAVAWIEAFLLAALGYSVSLTGTTLSVDGESFKIIVDCTGLVLVILFFALLYATPLKEEKREKALLWGAPFLFAFNLLRLLFALTVGAVLGRTALEAVHLVLWFADSGVALFLWAQAAEIKLLASGRRQHKKTSSTRQAK